METKISKLAGLSFSVTELLGMLWYGRRLIMICALAAGMVGFVVGMSRQPIYEAQGLLRIEPRSGSLNLPRGMEDLLGSGGTAEAYRSLSEMQILRSRSVMRMAAEKVETDLIVSPRRLPVIGLLPLRMGLPYPDLPFLRPYQWGNEGIDISNFSVPDDLRGQSFRLTSTDDGFVLTTPDGEEYRGRVGVPLEIAYLGVSLTVSNLFGPIGREYDIYRIAYDAAVTGMQARFAAVETPMNSSIIRITYKDVEPRRAEDVLDAISSAYLEQDVMRSAQEAMNSLGFIEQQLPLARKSVDEAQAALNAYRNEANSLDVDYETKSLLERETQLENELSSLDLKELDLKTRYTVTHPLYESLLREREELRAQLLEVRQLALQLPDTQKAIYNITRDLEVAQQVYVQLLNRQQELEVAKAATVGTVRIIDTALAPNYHIEPKTGVIIGAMIVIGTLFGGIYILVRNVMSRGVIDTPELERMGLQVYGIIPVLDAAQRSSAEKNGLALGSREIAESMKSLRTALHFGLSTATSKIVAITSAHPSAGKSFCSRNLAAAYAEAGQKVCLVDADMRKGVQAKSLRLSARGGLSEVLSGSLSVEQALQVGPVNGLYVLHAGTVPPNPSELLMGPRFGALLETLSEKVDLIILDAPPVLAVTDPLIIAKHADCTLFVARHLVTREPEITESMRLFGLNNVKLAGALLNAIDPNKSKQYGRYGYGNQGYIYNYDYHES
ncbi:MAG: polysaccharide biosynthesis tyrosine autokinase [Erythrobacter sp.]